ncbi:MAG: TRAP transporter substrate-binding protein DctP [Burkholderiales bacterium]
MRNPSRNFHRHVLTLCAALCTGALLWAAPDARADKFSFKIASGHGPNWHFVQLTQEYFIPEVKKRAKAMGHDVEFVEGFAGAMVKPTEVLEGLQSGIVDVGIYCVCHEAQKLPLHNFPSSLPFGPGDPEISLKATRRVYDQVPEINAQYEKRFGQRNLALVPIETYIIIANYPIRGPADVKGRKIGGAGPNMFWVENAGALPTMVLGPDIYTSFQSKLIDGMLILSSSMDQLKLYDVAPYLIKTDFGSATHITLNISQRTTAKLPKPLVDAIVQTGKDMEARAGTYTKEHEAKYLAILQKNGAKFVDIAPDQRKAWADLLAKAPGEIGAKAEKESNLPMRKAQKAYVEAAKALGHTWPVAFNLD